MAAPSPSVQSYSAKIVLGHEWQELPEDLASNLEITITHRKGSSYKVIIHSIRSPDEADQEQTTLWIKNSSPHNLSLFLSPRPRPTSPINLRAGTESVEKVSRTTLGVLQLTLESIPEDEPSLELPPEPEAL